MAAKGGREMEFYGAGLGEALEDLREDALLLRLAVRGTEGVDPLTFRCMARLCDYLDQHVEDLRHILEK